MSAPGTGVPLAPAVGDNSLERLAGMWMVCPTFNLVGCTPGLASSIAFTLTWNFLASELRLSPLTILYSLATGGVMIGAIGVTAAFVCGTSGGGATLVAGGGGVLVSGG